MSASLVGSEMCIRDRVPKGRWCRVPVVLCQTAALPTSWASWTPLTMLSAQARPKTRSARSRGARAFCGHRPRCRFPAHDRAEEGKPRARTRP
eukprot:2314037-Alexandrium_andersonii.AAC.1